MESHLLQMRGLKHNDITSNTTKILVASFTDAWIETLTERLDILARKSHLLQMRGLKLMIRLFRVCRLQSHLLQMRGLKRHLL